MKLGKIGTETFKGYPTNFKNFNLIDRQLSTIFESLCGKTSRTLIAFQWTTAVYVRILGERAIIWFIKDQQNLGKLKKKLKPANEGHVYKF